MHDGCAGSCRERREWGGFLSSSWIFVSAGVFHMQGYSTRRFSGESISCVVWDSG